MIQRLLHTKLNQFLQPNKVTLLYGPRRIGKTTLLEQVAKEYSGKVKFVDGEDKGVQEILSSGRLQTLSSFLGDTEMLIVDEAQKIPEIGSNLKLIVDHIPNIKVLASGSASFALAQHVGEPLTGRKWTLKLYPLSLRELMGHFGSEAQVSLLEHQCLIYGGYPEEIGKSDDLKKDYLLETLDSYLFRDILELEDIRNAKKLRDLLTLLAFQIGKEVSLNELGNQLDLNQRTVFRYLDLLEKSFVIINIRGFSRNLRKEVTKTSRYYFYDVGIRNALINNFNPLGMRNDVGQLWENFIVMERLKKQNYDSIRSNNYFWRTYDQKEIDWVEERDGKLYGYEIKWSPAKKQNPPRGWMDTYKEAEFALITRENFLDFI
jgi:hypothetical protein